MTDADGASAVQRSRVDERREWIGTALFFAAMTALCGIVFAPAISNPFFIDDFGYLGVTLEDRWWTSGLLRDFSAQVLRPVTVIAIGVQQELFGFDPIPYHVIALGLLAVQGVLLFLVARRLGVGLFGSRAAAAVLMLHTTNGWSIAWTASTSSYYAIVLGLGVVLLTCGPTISRRQMVGAVVLLAVGLLAREISIVVPFIVVAVRWMLAEGAWTVRARSALRQARPLLVLLGAFLAARVAASLYAQSQPEEDRLIPILNLTSFSDALPMVPDHVWSILLLATSPVQSVIGDAGFTFPMVVVVVGALIWAAIVGLVVHETRRERTVPLLGLVWFLIAVVPPIFLQPEITYGNYADMAVPGLALAIGAGAGALAATWPVSLRWIVAVVGIAVLAVVGYHGGNTLFRPPPPPVVRAVELVDWARREYPDPPPGSTITVTDPLPEDPLWTSNGDLFRVMYQDPTLQVVFGDAGSGAEGSVGPTG
ncbi:MAG: hypothetical protein ACK4V6_07740 [Microthrixaceae bacterium]